MAVQLTTNFVEALYKNEYDHYSNSIVQVLNVKTTASNTNRVIISDGKYFMQTLMSSQIMEQASKVKKNSLIMIKKCLSNRIQKKGVVSIFGILLDIDVLPYENLDKIGNPKNIQDVYPPYTVTGFNKMEQDQPKQNQSNENNENNQQNNNNNNKINNKSVTPNSGVFKNSQPNIFPIKSLSPYQNKWTIRAKAINKSDIRTWNNSRGQGRLFSVIFMDESSEIKATIFNDAVSQFFDLIQEDQMYYISGANIKMANKQFNTVKNDYEMVLDANTVVELCNDNSNIPQMHYSFIPLNQLMDIEKDSLIDVIGVVDEVTDVVQFTSKNTNKPIQRREIYIVDDTEYRVKVALWGKQAEDFKYEDKPVVGFKSIKVNDFGGRTLSALTSSILTINPDIVESHRIAGWYSQNGSTTNYKSYSNQTQYTSNEDKVNSIKTLAQIKDENLGTGDKPDFFNCIATIVFIKKDNFSYPACPSEKCNKKVIEEDDGWRCEKCNKTYPNPDYRYIMNIDVLDHTGNQWLNCFNESAEKLLHCKAQELLDKKNNDENEFNRVLDEVNFHKYNFRIRAKTDNYNDEVRLRCTINDIKPLNYTEQLPILISSIDKLMSEMQLEGKKKKKKKKKNKNKKKQKQINKNNYNNLMLVKL